MNKLIATVLLLFLSLPVCAEYDNRYAYSGNQILNFCKAYKKGEIERGKELYLAGICLGYINGALSALQQMELEGFYKPEYCIPHGVTEEQLALILVQSIEQNPKFAHIDAASLLQITLLQAYPCN